MPGDWIIRNPPDKDAQGWFSSEREMLSPLAQLSAWMGREGGAKDMTFTDHAVCVIDVTATHLTFYSPCFGRPFITPISAHDGNWHMATAKQVEVTWELAIGARDPKTLGTINMERKSYPFRNRRLS